MLRALRASDIPEYVRLYLRHFPEEQSVLQADGPAFEAALERLFRWDARLVLGLLRLLGRPIGRFLALELEGRLAGVTLVFFDRSAGYIGSVVVDTPYQRRGHARELMEAAESAIRARGIPYAVLDVFSENAPALALYEALGYRPIRHLAWYVRELEGNAPPLPPFPAPPFGRTIREFRPTDATVLAEIARARQPEPDRSVRPIGPRNFRVPGLVVQALASESQAYVQLRDGSPVGFLRVSSGRIYGAGHLVPPLTDPRASEEEALALLDAGLSWFRTHPVRRIVAELPDDDPEGIRRLTARGFAVGPRLQTLAKKLVD